MKYNSSKKTTLMIKHYNGEAHVLTKEGLVIGNLLSYSVNNDINGLTTVELTYIVDNDNNECGLFYNTNKP